MLVDTDVFIWWFRGDPGARRLLAKPDIELSVVSYVEIAQGVRNREEFRAFRTDLTHYDWRVRPLTAESSHRAMTYIDQFALSHGLRLADALIAATAGEGGGQLTTANDRHYRFIPDLALTVFRPTAG